MHLELRFREYNLDIFSNNIVFFTVNIFNNRRATIYFDELFEIKSSKQTFYPRQSDHAILTHAWQHHTSTISMSDRHMTSCSVHRIIFIVNQIICSKNLCFEIVYHNRLIDIEFIPNISGRICEGKVGEMLVRVVAAFCVDIISHFFQTDSFTNTHFLVLI